MTSQITAVTSDEAILEFNKKLGLLKTKLTNLEKFLSKEEKSSNQHEIQSRTTSLEKTFSEYDSLVNSFVLVVDDDKLPNFHCIFEEFENRYHILVGKLVLQSEHLDSNSPTPSEGDHGSINNLFKKTSNIQSKLIKLPEVKIPIFDGTDFTQWITFRDTYIAVIHDNENLDEIVKFTYLLDKLRGVAKESIGHITLTKTGYEKAWDTLIRLYDDPRVIVDKHIEALLDLDPIIRRSESEVRKLLNGALSHISSLNANDLQLDDLSQLIILKIINRKLDSTTRGEWEESIDRSKTPTWDEFQSFLEKKCRVLREIEKSTLKTVTTTSSVHSKPSGNFSKQSNNKTFPKTIPKSSYFTNRSSSSANCSLCGKLSHPYFVCPTFNNLTPKQRYEKVKEAQACFNCLNPNHKTSDCRSIRCRICHRPHHTLLHFEQPTPNVTNITKDQNSNVVSSTNTSSTDKVTYHTTSNAIPFSSNCHINSDNSEIIDRSTILPTAIVMIEDGIGRLIQCRALLDSGSQTHFVSESFVKNLNLKPRNEHITVTGLNNKTSNVTNAITTKIHSTYKPFSVQLDFSVANISNRIPSNTFNISRWQIPKNIKLSDPSFNIVQPVDILLGVEIFPEILLPNRIKLNPSLPIIQESIFGWLVFGKYEQKTEHNFTIFEIKPNPNDKLNKTLQQFWELENLPSKKFLSVEEKTCETYFNQTTFRNSDGRYVVSMPFRDDLENLGDSKSIALKRFNHIERKLNFNSELKQPYVDFINEYYQLGHMKLVDDSKDSDQITYYMPHHAVQRPSSSSTKLRVVFDASAKTSNKISLNDKMLIGPSVQDNLFDIILRFRTYKYVFSSDVLKMYRQIKINKSQTPLQRILWRENLNQQIQTYELQTVTYGTASAPYLATRVLKQLAHDERNKFPLASKIATKDFYVDDLISGSNDLETAKKIQKEIIQMFKNGGFHLHKWCSNNAELLSDIPLKDCEELKVNEFSLGNCIKALGLLWQPQEDFFLFKAPDLNKEILTKRAIVSDVAKLYDPLGFLSPIIITGKILIQQLWERQLDWDDKIPQEIQDLWINYQRTLISISQLHLNRNVMGHTHSNKIVRIELHGFSDASEKAYGACLYIKTIDSSKNISVNLLCSKSRVAPLKTISLPRLELSGAFLLAKLTNSVINALNINFNNIYLWSDSTITLCWIKTPPHKLKTFIANRVNEIQQLTIDCIWKHIESADNPADLISRGVMPNELNNNKLWWHGPIILLRDSYDSLITAEITDFDANVMELKNTTIVMFSPTSYDFINSLLSKFSSFEKLIRVIGYIIRWTKRTEKRDTKTLSVAELERSATMIIKLVQKISFKDEFNSLKNKQVVSKKSSLKSLNPFLDSDGVIRVGGRLNKAINLNYDVKHQILLPPKSDLTKLIFRQEHIKNHHPGPQLLLSFVRQKYWPIYGKNIAKQVVHSCVNCFRTKPVTAQQIMGDLPIERYSSFKAFLNTGVDFCGPFLVKLSTTRKASPTKMYVASFVCLCTKAIHLEIVQNLSSDSFINCLKRFISRRGKILTIWSDNASTFQGANNDLKEFCNLLRSQAEQTKIINFCTFERISWKFIPPRAPNFGGIWEASVKSFKTHLKRVTRDRILNYEEFHTLIIQIEGILNSRPLSVMSNDPNDPEPLTPSHFLTGTIMHTIPEPSYNHLSENRLSRYQLISKLVESFWKRFSLEYLHGLQTRSKWTSSSENLKPGDVVLLIQDNLPATKWPLSIVTSTVSGTDGKAHACGVISPLITIITNIPNPSIQGRGFRLLGNLAKHSTNIVKSIQESGISKAINSILNDSDNIAMLLMTIRLVKQLWDDKKFQNDFISSQGISKIMNLLLKYISIEKQELNINDTMDIDPNIVNLKVINGRNHMISRKKLNEMMNDLNKADKLIPDKSSISFDNKFQNPEVKEIQELVGIIVRCFQAVTRTKSSRIAEQLYANGLGYSAFVFLANDSSSYRPYTLNIISNLVSNTTARYPLGTADVVVLTTHLLTCKELEKPLDQTEIRYCVRIICLLTGDSCNRAKIRYSGALATLAERARNTECEKEFTIILYAFYQFRYDQISTDLLMEHGIVPILIKRLTKIIDDMNVDHIQNDRAQKVLDDNNGRSKLIKRKREFSPSFNMSPKHSNLELDPGSPDSSSGYGSCTTTSQSPPISPHSSSSLKQDVEEDSENEGGYSPVCSDVDEGSGVENDDKDNSDLLKSDKQFDIFTYMYDTCEESLLFAPSDTDDNDRSVNDKEPITNVLDSNIDFEKNPVAPILILLHNASLRNKYTSDFVRPETLTVLLKLSQLIPKPLEKLALLLANILRHSKNFFPILCQNFVYELSDLKRKQQVHDDCKSCTEVKCLAEHLLTLLGSVGESGYGRGQIAHFLLTGEKMIQLRSAILTTYIIKTPNILHTLLFEQGALKIVMYTILTEGEPLSNEASIGLTTLAINLSIGLEIVKEIKKLQYSIYDDTSNKSIDFTNSCGSEHITFNVTKNLKKIKFHKKILIETSDVFNSMLSNDFLESKDQEITLIEVSEDGLKYFLHLLTLKNLEKNLNEIPLTKSMDSILDAYELSIKYMLPDLEITLLNCIKLAINEMNALNVFEWALQHVNNETLEIAICYFLNSDISGEKKVKLYRDASKSKYSAKWEQLIVETILMKCSYECDEIVK